MKKTVTISRVAEEAGVSKTTISRYLNGKYENMSQETKERIAATIEQLDYHPNRQAQSLKSKRSYLIGVVVADISNIYSSFLLKGIGDVLKQSDYQMIIIDAGNSIEQENRLLRKLLDQGIEGIILQPSCPRTSQYDFLIQQNIPLILVDRETEPNQWPVITMNNVEATSKITNYILEKNYEKIAVVTEPLEDVLTRQIRYQTIRENIQSKNKKVQLIETRLDSTFKESILAAISSEEKTALFALNGKVLLELLKVLYEEKIKFPEDVGIAGYDDWNFASLIGPGVTSVVQQSEEIGIVAGEKMLGLLTENLPIESEMIIPAKIHLRNSL
ncbi:LacI family DNA-binding transcriptional regulator [Enterococcus timonensis]|uniref:LacI family DNA-binding transcriptional regulator n=1 Tax=Enterococcus timonensis TaxID=1852364 RepID=UPI0008D9B106|nr:LacI family DNA-binding transcriptional regulator [Enterococcus timonensis]